MNATAAATAPRPTPPSYGFQWAVFFVLLIGGLGAFFIREHLAFKHGQSLHAYEGPHASEWFMVLRMPEIPSAVTDVEAAQQALNARLRMLKREGFNLVLLSDIHRHITKGTALPPKPVVLVFDPGHRHTFDTLGPALRAQKVQAVWMTDGDALEHSDRRYVSKHAGRMMVRSGLWDVGLYEAGKPVVIKNSEEGEWRLADNPTSLWSASAGVFALNEAKDLKNLNRLNVNSTWTPDEFIDRVRSELPIREPVKLFARLIRNHLWGLSAPMLAPMDPAFTLESNLEKRGATVSWLGTRGLYDADISLSMKSLSGEAWILFRSDENVGESVRVGFLQGVVYLEQEKDHQTHRLLAGPAEGVGYAGRPVNAQIRLHGSQISVTVNGRKTMTYNALSPNQTGEGVLRFTVYDKLRGTAQADGVSIRFTPSFANDSGA